METKLLSCPFCGGEARVREFYIGDCYEELTTIDCQVCGVDIGCFETEAEAIEAWNARVYRPCCPQPCTPSCWYEGVD